MSLFRLGVSAGVLLGLGLVVTGCGSGSSSGSDAHSSATALQGSDPVAWTGTLCTGLGDVIGAVVATAQSGPSPQNQKDGMIAFFDTAQRAFNNTAQKLETLGPPKINDGKKVQEAAVGFFHTAAGTVGEQRIKLAALDAKDPDFMKKAGNLAGPDLSAASAQMQNLANNKDLAPAFSTASACQRLPSAANGK